MLSMVISYSSSYSHLKVAIVSAKGNRTGIKLNRTYAGDMEVAKVGGPLTKREALDAAHSRGRSKLSFSKYATASHF